MPRSNEKSDKAFLSIDLEKNQEKQNALIDSAKILCVHCGRSNENSVRCLGKCVADSDY